MLCLVLCFNMVVIGLVQTSHEHLHSAQNDRTEQTDVIHGQLDTGDLLLLGSLSA